MVMDKDAIMRFGMLYLMGHLQLVSRILAAACQLHPAQLSPDAPNAVAKHAKTTKDNRTKQ